MIIIDMSQIMMASVFALTDNKTGLPITRRSVGGFKSNSPVANTNKIDNSFMRFICLNSLRYNISKFKREYGSGSKIVIACDGDFYWRKDEFPFYKAARAAGKQKSPIDFCAVYDGLNNFKKELKYVFPYTVIEVNRAEADDVIGTLCHEYGENNQIGYPKEKILIISGDHDFFQLQCYSNVKQYSPVKKKYLTINNSPQNYLFEHIVTGDSGDGIPNIFSSGDCLVMPDKRQIPATKKKIAELKETSPNGWSDSIRSGFDRNKKLIDLKLVPSQIKKEILKQYKNNQQNGNSKSKLLDYFMKNRLREFVTTIDKF